MEVKKFLHRILTSPLRTKNKASTLEKLLNNQQQHGKVINIHRIDRRNAGDFYSAPYHYYEEIDRTLDIFSYKSSSQNERDHWVKEISNSAIILGGGGLLNRQSFKKQMLAFEKLAVNNKKIVLWGIGHNSKKRRDFGNIRSYNIDINKFGLVGTRDYSMPGDYVPCVSCKHEVFDKSYEVNEEIGLIFHKKTLKKNSILKKFSDYSTTSNTRNMEKVVNFIGSKEKIITDSYHAMYWALLLEKKVAVIPNSSKFYDFKYKPVFTTFEDCLTDINKASAPTGVLEECRELNMNFFLKVKEYLEI